MIYFPFFYSPGYYTGSLNYDPLLKNDFKGEGVKTGEVVAIKTHRYGTGCPIKYKKAIILMRHPVGAILADFNRQATNESEKNSHIGKAHPGLFNSEGKFFTDNLAMGPPTDFGHGCLKPERSRCIRSL